jgi:hypothetical protein
MAFQDFQDDELKRLLEEYARCLIKTRRFCKTRWYFEVQSGEGGIKDFVTTALKPYY